MASTAPVHSNNNSVPDYNSNPDSDSDSRTTTTTTRIIINENTNDDSSNSSSSSSGSPSSSHKRKNKSTRTERSSLTGQKRIGSTPNNLTGNKSETQPHRRWKTEKQQQIYSSNLIQALSKVNLNPSSPTAPRRGRAVREAADRALAVAARGRSRWSRAILSRRRLIKLMFRKQRPQQQKNKKKWKRRTTEATGNGGGVRMWRLKGKSVVAVQRKVRVLSRLVPGCRKEKLPVILEEATDYIAALEMQVRAMSALANLLSRSDSVSVSVSNTTSTTATTNASTTSFPTPMRS